MRLLNSSRKMSKPKQKNPIPVLSPSELPKLISLLENGNPQGFEKLKKLYSKTGNAKKIGITGPPGVGKSTLVDKLIEHFRKDGKRVAVTAVDPTSPVSGGALLGDRIRMQRHAADDAVFIRSLASRAHRGGLTSTIRPILHALDISGFDILLIETVGTGQDEIEIQDVADMTVVVFGPGSGDSIQFAKSGIVDIGDILVVNKSDKPESTLVFRELEMKYHLKPADEKIPKIISVSGITGDGIEKLYQSIQDVLEELSQSEELEVRRREQVMAEVLECLKNTAVNDILRNFYKNASVKQFIGKIERKELDPYTVSDELYRQFIKK